MIIAKKDYKVFSLSNFRQLPQVEYALSEEQKHMIDVVGNVLPFKLNNYVVDELIDWNDIPNDPIFQLTFPQKGMLSETHFRKMEHCLSETSDRSIIKNVANSIRLELNPNPSGQEHNVPMLDGQKLTGIQHKYRETVLFFPNNGQTCHAYCTFCFRWPQFVGIDELKFALRESELLIKYLHQHPEVTDVLFTGGDPMVMSAKSFATYTDSLMDANIENLQTIRIGTKSLSYWPYKYLTDKDSDDMIRQFEKIVKRGYHLAIMAHFNHPNELKTPAVQQAIKRIRNTGTQIRTQSPLLSHINDNPQDWKEMWNLQIKLGCIPYYMFVARNTGAQDYFSLPLERAFKIYRKTYQQVSGIARTVRGPSMSSDPGKIHILGIDTINGEKVYVLRFVQCRDASKAGKVFFAKYNPNAHWIDDLEPAFGQEQFFFEEAQESNAFHLNY